MAGANELMIAARMCVAHCRSCAAASDFLRNTRRDRLFHVIDFLLTSIQEDDALKPPYLDLSRSGGYKVQESIENYFVYTLQVCPA